MHHQRQEPESTADIVHGSPSDADAPSIQSWPQPIRDGHWTDQDGNDWHLRGGRDQLAHRVLRRLLKRHDLRVLHAYGLEPAEVSGPAREALLERVNRYLAGVAPPHSQFWLAEFRDDKHDVMLVIQEAC